MFKSLIYKEWRKTYMVIIPFFFLFLGIMLDTLLDARKALEFYEPVQNLMQIAFKNRFQFNYIGIASLVFAASFGVFQFYPEISQARVRLHLHLPLSYTKLVGIFILYGLAVLSLFFALVTLGYYCILTTYYPVEVFWAVFSKLLPTFLSALFLYLTTSLVFVTPRLKSKFAYITLGILIMRAYYPHIQKLYFETFMLNIAMVVVLVLYTAALFHAFSSYKRGYIK